MQKFNFTNKINKKIAGIFFDVDGVLKKGRTAILGARESLIYLREKNIPFAIITNGGGETESDRAIALNKILNLDSHDIELKPYEVFLCHSPMKPILDGYGDKTVLISGTGNTKSVMKEYNHNNYLTVEEYVALYPHMFCHFFVEELNKTEDFIQVRNEVENRLQREMKDFPVIDAIFMLTDIVRWEINIQLFSDLLISKDGKPGTLRTKDEKQEVDFHLCSQDLLYKDSFIMPRIAAGAFWYSLEHIFFMKYKRKIEYMLYGKPDNRIFEYAKTEIQKKYPDREISHFYMVGDNPPVDIKGANESGIESILVRTGVFIGDENDLENPAKYVVKDVNEAVRLVTMIENL